ncbi:PREDICTED: TIR domain-containing adapter molecule 1 [Gekko japonicus]|uniref:TIR domain-containing adapter molecule 1 n=1 Tax=Gekko japonicus TaxID=146911 RepID=A0ABM1KQU2_GEKJA|nr:PREDICTED: TIR domain-containing adapter molecule 1 [Gekko japonicus]XP_015276079.1 PREDICTED: TIR domain-containing adapter molecule 1 [Gekko japonicus]
MAEHLKARPSFECISGLLAGIPEDKLVLLKHKLNCVRQDTRSCKLLQAMILLTLRREAEAREILDTLGDDVAAAHICRSHWGSTQVSAVHPPTQEAQVAQAVAQIYSLLVELKLCGPQARDEAYRAAIKAFCSNNGVQSAKLDALLAEARDKCGLGFAAEVASGGFNTLKTGSEKLPRSVPVPINRSLGALAKPLRSTGTPASFVSHFEISDSPTVPYLSRVSHRCGAPEASKLCEIAPGSSAQPGEGGTSLVSPSVSRSESPGVQEQPKSHSTDDLQGSCLGSLGSSHNDDVLSLEESVRSPVECTEPPNIMPAAALQDLKEDIPPNLRTACPLLADPATEGCIQTSVEYSCSPCQSTGPKDTSSSTDVPPVAASSSSSTDSTGDEDQFFMFVVVHANEDESIACRVRERLENMGVSNGATFCEDFLVPGHNQLACFQDALDNSAFTLLLLTENFKSHLCTFQTNMALMNSFTRIVKANSVIPFIPKESPLKKGEMPGVLAGLVSLDENSRVFERRAKNTFRLSEFQTKKLTWSMNQQIRRQERLREQQQDYWQMQQRLLALSLQPGYPAQVPFPPTQMGLPGLPQVPPSHVPPPFFLPTSSMPGMFQPPPGPGQATHFQPFSVPLPTPMPQGPQPHLVIQHAQMVQIGDYNRMQVERTNAALGVADEKVDESQGTEAEARQA